MHGECTLLRAYLLSTDHIHFATTFERLVQHACRQRLAGATVLRGIYGFGSRGIQNPSAQQWHLAQPAPVIVEIVDRQDRIEEFVCREIPGILTRGMFTLERAGVLFLPATQRAGAGEASGTAGTHPRPQHGSAH